MLNNIEDVLGPLLFSKSLQSRGADLLFKTSGILVGQVRQFHRFKNTVNNQRRTQSRTQTEKEHATTAITAQRLHCRVVDDFHRDAERFCEIEFDPAFAEVSWIFLKFPLHNPPGTLTL